MSSDYAIEVTNLGKCYQIYDKPSDRLKQMLFRGRRQYYREFWALKDISFKVKKGETVGIIGRNGSGKSTLLQMICGTLNSTEGGIKVNGKVAALLELGAGFNPEFTGVENVYMAASLYGLRKEEIEQRFGAIAAFADIGDHINQPVKTYSSGMFVRLAFSVIANVDADILVIDEALAVGDAFFNQKCLRFINQFKSSGRTILYVSHDISSMLILCDSGVLLEKNDEISTCLIGPIKELSKIYLEDFYKNSEVKSFDDSRLNYGLTKSISSSACEVYDSLPQNHSRFVISNFNKNASRFGNGAVRIVDCGFYDNNGNYLNECIGSQKVTFKVIAQVNDTIHDVAFGLIFKDKNGQKVFTESSSKRLGNLVIVSGANIEIEFIFLIPELQVGDFMIDVAVAEGIGDDHLQQDWVYDAVYLNCIESPLSHGLAGFYDSEISVSVMTKL